jgi:hypothetical protein
VAPLHRRLAAFAALATLAVAGAAAPPVARAGAPWSLQVDGSLSVWWTLHEQVANGLRQPQSGDKAVEEASGFNLYRARLGGWFRRGELAGRVTIRFEGSPPGLLDAHLAWPIRGERLRIVAGQMKIPATYEVALSEQDLDFVTRSRFSTLVADFSLVRSPALSSPRFNGARTYLRDLGLAARGAWLGVDYFLMVGNGLGANRFVGGREEKEEIFANRVGAYFYGVRLSAPLLDRERSDAPPLDLIVGGHVCWNRHPDILLDDERTVLDLRRRSWSLDGRARLGERLRLTAMVGAGVVDDDFDHDGRTDYAYRGFELKSTASLLADRLRAGARYDLFVDESYENGAEERQHAYTFGLEWVAISDVRLLLNYKRKTLDSETAPDLADDVLTLALIVGVATSPL